MLTIYLPDARGFWISGTKWNHPPTAFERKYDSSLFSDWRWIGWAGWYGTEENKKIHDYLKSLKLLDNWQYGEYDEVEDLSMESVLNAIASTL